MSRVAASGSVAQLPTPRATAAARRVAEKNFMDQTGSGLSIHRRFAINLNVNWFLIWEKIDRA